MKDSTDIRDRELLGHADITGLNFIKSDLPYVLRRHYREGLRSHIFEVHDLDSIRREREGILHDGIPVFPRSVPRSMLRLFRHRFRNLQEALEEISRFQIMLEFISDRFIALSSEFLVEYRLDGQGDILLCGLQEYVRGIMFDPWSYERNPESLSDLIDHVLSLHAPGQSPEDFRRSLDRQVRDFVQGTKRLIVQAGYIPDLSGVGNLILTPEGALKLVDINNISPVSYEGDVFLDDKGYPVCDKSVEVLAILERKLLRAEIPPVDDLYSVFLDPERMARVRDLEKRFRRSLLEATASSA